MKTKALCFHSHGGSGEGGGCGGGGGGGGVTRLFSKSLLKVFI